MGWTFFEHREKMSMKDLFQMEFDRDKINYEILAASTVGSACYMAIKELQTGRVFGEVCLIQRAPKDRCNFGYKNMSESMGPYYYDCPKKVLDLLTETDNESALKWRAKCRERLAIGKVKLVVGSVLICADNPIKFSDRKEPRHILRCIDPKKRYFRGLGLNYSYEPDWFGAYKLTKSHLTDLLTSGAVVLGPT